MAEPLVLVKRHRASIVYVLVLLVAVVLSLTGVSLWFPVAVGAAPWFLVLARHSGPLVAGVASLLGLMFITLSGLIVTNLLRLEITTAFLVLSVLIGATGVLVVRRVGRPTIDRSQWLAGLASLLGGLIWTGAVFIAAWIPGASHYSWVMNGDSANNVLFVRDLFAADGITIGPGENPVPLPAGLLAIGMAAGRAGVPSSGLLAHDIGGFVQVWALAIAMLCTLTGLIAAASVPTSRRVVRAIAAAAGSLLPLTWYIVGYPIEYGFMNTQVALAIVLCGWLVYLRSDRRPAFTIGLLSAASTLLLAAWGPLVLLTAALILAIVIRHFRALLSTRGIDAVVALTGLGQLVVFGLASTVPVFFAQGAFLAAAGGAFPFSRVLFFGLAALLIVLGVVGRALGPVTRTGAIALALATVAGAAVLLFTARSAPNPWISYYPLKFLWLGGVVMFIAILGMATGLATTWFRSRIATVIALAVIAVGTIVGVGVAQHTTIGYVQRNPVVRLFAGDFWGEGDTSALRAFDHADLENPTILWRSDDPFESAINFWVFEMQAGSMYPRDVALRLVAYGDYDVDQVSDLCRIVPLMEAPVDVLTADSDLAEQVARECPEIPVRILPFEEQR